MTDSKPAEARDCQRIHLNRIVELRREILLAVEQLERGEGIRIANDAELAAFFDEIADEVDCELDEK